MMNRLSDRSSLGIKRDPSPSNPEAINRIEKSVDPEIIDLYTKFPAEILCNRYRCQTTETTAQLPMAKDYAKLNFFPNA